ncbi:hypothetical protein FRC05_005905 [Tulasnella sp. 425]|nr:hypothetical protein FRC05_005905 [Tulasnella sp. 425]
MQDTVTSAGPVRLVPTLPSFNPRYDRTVVSSQARLFSIPSQALVGNDFPDVKPSPTILVGFEAFVHPEGDLYWFNGSKRILTNLDPALSHWKLRVDAAYQQVVELLGGTPDLPLSSELCLTAQQAGSLEVGYYLVNRDKKVLYWPEEVDVHLLGIGPFESNVDLRGALTSEYWIHVDYFPGHHGLDRQAEESLVATLRRGCIDDMAAPRSTLPWSAEECRQFLNIIEGFRSITSDDVLAERMSCVARLSAAISRGRRIHGYGALNARLDRFRAMEGDLDRQTVRNLTLTLGGVLAQARVNIKAFQRQAKLLLNTRPVRRYARLFNIMHRRFMGGTTEGEGTEITTSSEGLERAQTNTHGSLEKLATTPSNANLETRWAK